ECPTEDHKNEALKNLHKRVPAKYQKTK
uniref:Uncharacterized protein n=1 Tax=Caenorhabditis japonica TaxID=281687 RepID=A0A8R1EWX1_CAEJA